MVRRSSLVLTLLAILLVLLGCSSTSPPAVSEVVIDQGDVVLEVGQTVGLSVTVRVVGGASTEVTWGSSDEAVATVSEAGVLTGVAEGEAMVSATSSFDASRSTSVMVTVLADDAPGVVSVSIDQDDVALVVGATAALTATVEVVGGASDEVVWSSDDASIATVSDEGVVTGVAQGEATVVATSTFDDARSASVTVTVVADDEPAVLSVSIDQGDVALEVGQTVELSVTVRVVGGASSEVTWVSSDEAVATVSGAGVVTGVAEGEATIVATSTFDDARSASLAVTVIGLGHVAVVDILMRDDLRVRQYRYALDRLPPGSVASFPFAPSEWQNRYTPRRRHFALDLGDGLGVMWQDAGGGIQFARISSNLEAYDVVTLPDDGNVLMAAANDSGTLFYITLEMGSRSERAARLLVHRYARGHHTFEELDTSPEHLNTIVSDDRSTLMSLQHHDGRLAFILARTLHRSADGLNHQAADAMVLDADSLAPITGRWQTSGHSFDGFLTMSADGYFLGVDLGDNYPRGVHLHKFDESDRFSRVVYTFKTKHGTQPTNSAGTAFPVYEEISTADRVFYRWSNDNNTYTELAAVVETARGYTVVFVGEPDDQGRAINNTRIGDGYLIDARNIGMVTVRKDFESVPVDWAMRNVVPDELIVTAGAGGHVADEGAFYDFRGGWQPQRNTGVVWLTEYRDATRHNASRPKAISVGEDRILVLWETWSATDYRETYMMIVDPMGREVVAPTPLERGLRLHRRDDPIAVDGVVYVITSCERSRRLEITSFDLGLGGSAPMVSVSLEPSSVTLPVSGTQSFAATVTGTGDTRVSWHASCGSISGSGSSVTYTAPASVPVGDACRVRATSVVDEEARGEAMVTVMAGPVVSVRVEPASVTLPVSGSRSFTATVSDASDTSVSWSATCGTFSGSGNTISYTAPSAVGSCSVTATSSADPSKSANASVTVVTVFERAPATVSITNVSLGVASGGVRPVSFDISWPDSWRGPSRPSWVAASDNWDAAWVFAKYRVDGGAWQHATLAGGGHVVPSSAVVDVPDDRVGAFIYRSSGGYGTFTASGVGLAWDYVADGVTAGASVEVQPFGIEMVYVPAGSFSVGSGGSSWGEFRAGGTSNSPFVVGSQSSIQLGDSSGQLTWTGFESAGWPSGSTNASFPTGYAAFYVMKYQVTQGQYVDFLNTLTQLQADTRKHTGSDYRYAITGGSVGSYSTSMPFVALNSLSWADGAAFADWAGLRPMTELEFEKAARGPLSPVANEYAWGSASITQATGLANTGTITETPTPAGANAQYANWDGSLEGPVRVGSFATPGRSRRYAGAGYYGALELSGNVWERPVTVGNAEGRAFAGTHGDGVLNAVGNANVSSWPNSSAIGAGFRGGCWGSDDDFLRVSSRGAAAGTHAGRDVIVGWRGARSAP